MADLEVGGLQHTSSITKDARKKVGLYAGILGICVVYKSMNFDDPSMYNLAHAGGASSTGREEGPTQVELVAPLRRRRVAEKAILLVGGQAHV